MNRKDYILINTSTYVEIGDIMSLKQISLSIPEGLFKASKEYSKVYGYKNIQEIILELLRQRVFFENNERYEQIEKSMKKSKTFSQEEAIKHIKGL